MKNNPKKRSHLKIYCIKRHFAAFLAGMLFLSASTYAQTSAGTAALSAAGLNPTGTNTLNGSLSGSNSISSEIQTMLQSYDKQIYFTENKGQWPANVLYKADFPLGQAIATKQGMMVGTFDPASIATLNANLMADEKSKQSGLPYTPAKGTIKGHGWMMDFVNSSSSMRIETMGRHPDTFNYILGNDASKYAIGVNNYQEIWYHNVYQNVDVRYYPSAEGTLEYDIVCMPGFNSRAIALKFDGINQVTVDKAGRLTLITSVGNMQFPAPVAYQVINGKQKSVVAKYLLTSNNELEFELGSYDKSQPLIIDPIALRWATWITNNSTNFNHGHCVWVDPKDGSIYVAGKIDGTGLIAVNAFQNAYAGGSGCDVWLGKYTEPDTVGGSGTRVWQTYIGGTGDDNPYAMQQGPDGNLYVVGYTGSTNFPLIGGSAFNGGKTSINESLQTTDNVFVLKFNTAGNAWKSAIVGGNGQDNPYDLRIMAGGSVVVCGLTTSTNLATLFPGSGASNTNNGGNDVLIFEINSDLSAISWMKNYGGSGNDQANIMLADTISGDIFVAGQTASSNFPTTKPRQSGLAESQDAFIQKLKSTGATAWSSYFNSSSKNSSAILCMEFNTTESSIYLGGITTGLASSNVSTSKVYQTAYGGGAHDFFAVHMDTAQTFLTGTYLGGSGDEINMMGLNVDLNNDVYIFGYSNSTNFPITSNALQSLLNNSGSGSNHDKTFTKLRTDLDSLDYSTYYGGSNDDYDPVGERGIKFSNCRIYTIVTAESNDIPLTKGALTLTKTSSSSVYEPGLVVWANPPDLLGNSISGSQNVCPGSVPTGFSGSVPAYMLPTIMRNSVASAYPASLPSATTYEWQSSTDSIKWTDVAGGTTQNLVASLIGHIYVKTYFRRIIGGDACVLSGVSGQTITIKILILSGTVTNATCFGVSNGSITVNPTNGTTPYKYSWTGGTATQTLSNVSAGTYRVIVTDAAGCVDTSSYTVGQPATAVSAKASSTPATCILSDGSANVTASGGVKPYTYLWSNGAVTSSISSVTQGIYTVAVTDSNKCALQVKDTVAINNTTNASAGANGVITCLTGPQITLNGSSTTSGVTYSWAAGNGGNIVSGASTTTPVVNAAGTYTLTVSKAANGCSATSATSVTLNNTPPVIAITANGPLTFCQGRSVVLSGNGGVSYRWSTGATTSSITVSSKGIYSVTGTDAKSCTATSGGTAVNINANPAINISAGGVTTFCNGGAVVLNANGGVSYAWSTGGTSPSITVTSQGTYSVTGTDGNGCSTLSAGTPVTVNANPVVNVPSISICEGLSGTLCANSTGSSLKYSWGYGNTGQCLTVYVPATYSVGVTDGNGCHGAAAAAVTSSEPPVVTVTRGGPTTFCQGDSVVLSASGAANYLWNTGSTSSVIAAKAQGMYSVVGNNVHGCNITVLISVSVNSLPKVTITPDGNTTFCQGGSVNLNVSGAGTYVWSNNSNDLSITANSSGKYSVIGTDGNGCTASASSTVVVNPLPTVSLSSFNPTCLNAGAFDLNEGSPVGGIYSGAGVSNNGFDPVAAGGVGSYPITYSYTNVKGCTNNASAPMQVISLPDNPQAIAGLQNAVCANTSGSYSIAAVNSAASYTWTVPGGASITGGQGTSAISLNFGNSFTSGMLSVMANNACGSTSNSKVISSVPAVPAAILGDGNPCNRGDNLYWVNAVAGAASYIWNVPTGTTILSGQGTDTLNVSTGNSSGYISVSASNTCGVSAAATSMYVNVECRTMNPVGESSATNNSAVDNLNLLLYPNPAHDMLYLQFNSSDENNYSIRILDVTGREVGNESGKAEAGSNFISLHLNFASGMYMVSLTTGGVNKQVKVIIE